MTTTATLAGQYAGENAESQRIAVITTVTAFGGSLADVFIKSLQAQGVQPVSTRYVDDKTIDFGAVLTTVRKTPI